MLGSCVSSGPYYRLRPVDLHMAICRTGASLVSLMSPAVRLDPSDLESLSRFERRTVEGDVTRTALDFLENGADFYLLDLGDETCNLLRMGESFVTLTSFLRKSLFLSRLPNLELIRRDDPATTRLWLEACTRFCRGPLAAISQDRIILHRVQLASDCPSMGSLLERAELIRDFALGTIPRLRQFSPGRALGQFISRRMISRSTIHESFFTNATDPISARSLNPILDTYFQHLRRLLPGAHVIDVPDQYRIMDRSHRFGLHPLHYGKGYDKYFISTLRNLTRRILESGVKK